MNEYDENNIDWFEEEMSEFIEEDGGICIYTSDDIIQEYEIYQKGKKDKPGKKSLKISIRVDPDGKKKDSFTQDPYIKLCNDTDWNKATKTVRIGLYDGRIFHHKDGKGEMDVNSDVVDFLKKVMDEDSNISKYKGIKVKEAIFQAVEDTYSLPRGSVKRKLPDFDNLILDK